MQKFSRNKLIFSCFFRKKRVFQGRLNRIQARIFAQNAGKLTIEMTPGGRWLNQEMIYSRMPDTLADRVWSTLSKRYAYNVQGEAYAFANNANPLRTYLQVERPILQKES